MADYMAGSIKIGGNVPKKKIKGLLAAIVAEGAQLEYGGSIAQVWRVVL